MSDELKPQATIDSTEFRELLYSWQDATEESRYTHSAYADQKRAFAALIAHIDSWGARLASIPTGYKLVPSRSTVDMLLAGRTILRACGCENVTGRDAELCWSAMIAAAPTPKEDA
jgi:hypothetical protein